MSIEVQGDTATKESLSALADGELDAAGVARAAADWRRDPQARACWHAYQLIGDVLRSGDLASTARHDADFIATLRLRLADEPVVLTPMVDADGRGSGVVAAAPGVLAASRRRKRLWIASTATAAGFVMVVGASLALRPASFEASPQIAEAAGVQPQASLATVSATTAPRELPDSPPVPADAKLIRDARLDRYLAAHKQFSGTSVLGLPSGFLRDSATDASTR